MNQETMDAELGKYIGQLEAIIGRFRQTHNAIHIAQGDDAEVYRMVLELRDLFEDGFADGKRPAFEIGRAYNDAVSNFTETPSLTGVRTILGVVTAARERVRRNPAALKAATNVATPIAGSSIEPVLNLAARLPLVIRQLRARREDRDTLDVRDEYDLQDLFHALLKIHFDDVRPEEGAPSLAGKGSRMDFLLPAASAVVELKSTLRQSLTRNKLIDELVIDMAFYEKHPDCKTLICVVYDPEHRITNPGAIETDLSGAKGKLTTKVIITPH